MQVESLTSQIDDDQFMVSEGLVFLRKDCN